jgi:hypothetical protein
MSVRESLVKHLSAILRSSEATLMVLLSDESGLSIARIGRSTELELDPNTITSVSAAAFSSSDENWSDLKMENQIITFSFFEKICLITIRIGQTLLTIVHDYNKQWPLNADNIGSCIYHLRREIDNYFGTVNSSDKIEVFSNGVRSAIYLFGMGTEVPLSSYAKDQNKNLDEMVQIGKILDNLKNPVLSVYSLVAPSGLTYDQRNKNLVDIPISVEAFSANTNVAFQKMVEEAGSLKMGSLISYVCISAKNKDSYYGILACPSGRFSFKDKSTGATTVQDITFISLFPLTYGAIPVLGEIRNIVHSIQEIIGAEKTAEALIKSINSLSAAKFS